MEIKLYLCGGVQKNAIETESKSIWSGVEKRTLSDLLTGHTLVFLDPNDSFVTSDRKAKFGRDIFQVSIANAVLLDARQKRGIGAGVELAYAKMRSIPVLAFAPANSYYVRRNALVKGKFFDCWIHPFVKELSDAICQSLEELSSQIKRFCCEGEAVKSSSTFESAVSYYKSNFLEHDESMKNLCIR
jgi:hypothetical protein